MARAVRYVLLVAGSHSDGSTSKDVCESAEGRAWVDDLRRRGVYESGDVLRPPDEAATVQVRGMDVLVSDGPFAETKDQVGGIAVINCANLEEATEIAATHPSARSGSIEVRPIWET